MSVTVFELIESRAQKIFVGLTELPLEQEYARLRLQPPPSLKAWDWESVRIRPVESFGDPKLARAFYERYAAKTPPPGWAVLTG